MDSFIKGLRGYTVALSSPPYCTASRSNPCRPTGKYRPRGRFVGGNNLVTHPAARQRILWGNCMAKGLCQPTKIPPHPMINKVPVPEFSKPSTQPENCGGTLGARQKLHPAVGLSPVLLACKSDYTTSRHRPSLILPRFSICSGEQFFTVPLAHFLRQLTQAGTYEESK